MGVFAACTDHLCQGDVFSLDALGAHSGLEFDVLRKKDKTALLGGFADVEYFPFSAIKETVAASETLRLAVTRIRRFIIATQTCDVAGIDHEAIKFCTIAKIVSLGEFLSDPVPLEITDKDKGKVQVMVQLKDIAEKMKPEDCAKVQGAIDDELAIPNVLRQLLPTYRKGKPEDVLVAYTAKLTGFLNNVVLRKNGHVWYLPEDKGMKIPESFVDFSCLYAVPTTELQEARASRLATIASPYRELFAQDLGLRFSRVAVETHAMGNKF